MELCRCSVRCAARRRVVHASSLSLAGLRHVKSEGVICFVLKNSKKSHSHSQISDTSSRADGVLCATVGCTSRPGVTAAL